MEIGSTGSSAQSLATQSAQVADQRQVQRNEQEGQQQAEVQAAGQETQTSQPDPNQRVGTVVDTQV